MRVSALRGVEAAGMVDSLTLGPNRDWDTPVPQGKTLAPGAAGTAGVRYLAAAGTIASAVAARLIASLLFGTSPWNAASCAGMILLLVAVAILSGYFPARRAARVDSIPGFPKQLI
jgi:hypothetical protein